MIDLRQSVVGTVMVDELYQVMSRTNDVYNVLILALPDVNEGAGPVATELPLVIYILLVNRLEMFPRLAIDSPLVSSRTTRIGGVAGEAWSDHASQRESQFHDSVKFHRRKMGYGSLGSPSTASEIVFNPHLLDEFMQGLKVCGRGYWWVWSICGCGLKFGLIWTFFRCIIIMYNGCIVI